MVKKIVFLFFTFIYLNATSQDLPIDKQTNKISYKDVIEANGFPKEILCKNLTTWIVNSYKSLNVSFLDYILIDQFKFPLKGYFYIDLYGDQKKITYDLTIDIKDNKYRYEFTNFFFEEVTSLDNYPKLYVGKKKVLEKTNKKVIEIIADLKNQLSKDYKSSEW